jgi:hypothetical protein
MKKKSLRAEEVKCFGCGVVLSDADDKEIGLCKSCSERSIEEGFEMVESVERDDARADAMMYA